MPRRLHIVGFLCLLPVLTSCAMHSTATSWNGHVGPDGRPVFVCSSTYLGLHLFGMLPMVGNTTVADMIDETTRHIAPSDGTRLRVVETESSNYWWSLPPLSWLFSPVMTGVTIEYRPSPSALAKVGVFEADAAVAEPAR